jgi:ATP-dependent Clp protease ATP-binding subunit ClpC
MFERYTERARRVLFFARYEASQLGSISIETEHLLLGLIREGKGLTSRIFARSHLSLENIRKDIEGRTVFREKVSTSVEIPFSAETKRVLQVAAPNTCCSASCARSGRWPRASSWKRGCGSTPSARTSSSC